MIVLDRDHHLRAIKERMNVTNNPLHLRMLERILVHAKAEVEADYDTLVGTLGANPEYHFWDYSGDVGPKSFDGVSGYYKHLVEMKGHILEYKIERIVVDDTCVVTEGELTMIQPGALMAEHAMAGGFADVTKNYLLKMRNVIFWSFDDEQYVLAEDSYTGGPIEMRELTDDELPDDFRALL